MKGKKQNLFPFSQKTELVSHLVFPSQEILNMGVTNNQSCLNPTHHVWLSLSKGPDVQTDKSHHDCKFKQTVKHSYLKENILTLNCI